jgi:hypothetical protein
MDNYFLTCPAMMSDGRLFTDYRASQVREDVLKKNNRLETENDVRSFITENGDRMLNNEWNKITQNVMCYPRKECFHNNERTKVTTLKNNSEILVYNKVKPNYNTCNRMSDYRLTNTYCDNYDNLEQKVNNNNKYRNIIARPYNVL